jgi:hypothetical protein
VSRVTIVSVSWRSAAYLEPLICNLREKASAAERLKVTVIDNTGGRDSELSRLSDAEVLPFTPAERNGSRSHARALDFAMPRIDTEFALVVDPDVHVFGQGWDALCIAELDRCGALAIGAPYPPWKIGKYHDLPSPPFCFFRVGELRQLGTSWMAYDATVRAAGRNFVLRQVGRVGLLLTRRRYERSAALREYASWAERRLGVCDPDTGWRVAEAARGKGHESVLFDVVLPGSTAFNAGSEAFQMLAREYELYTYAGRPFLTHKYGSAGLPWRTARGGDVGFWRGCIARVERELGGEHCRVAAT